MLSNAYFLAKFRFDTAENEPAENLQILQNFAKFADPNPLAQVYALGGRNGFGALSSVERFDATTGAWDSLAPMLQARSRFAATALDGKILCLS